MNATCTDTTPSDPAAGGDLVNDSTLITAIAGGSHAAFETLVRIYGGQMTSVARRFLRRDDDVNDALQEALVCVFKNAARFEGNSKLSTWLHRITVNACLMKLRSQRRRHEVQIDDLLPAFDDTGHQTERVTSWSEGPVETATREELRQRVRDCIDQLPDDYRSVLLLRDIEQMDTDETARMLGCTSGCVKTRLHRARMALRTLLASTFDTRAD